MSGGNSKKYIGDKSNTAVFSVTVFFHKIAVHPEKEFFALGVFLIVFKCKKGVLAMAKKIVHYVKKVSDILLGEKTAPLREDAVQLRIESFENYMRTEVM